MSLVSHFLLFVTTAAAAAVCNTTFDGRIRKNATASLFTSAQSPYNPKYVLGQNVTWDQVIKFPDIEPSKYDKVAGSKPIEVVINDTSIFASTSEGAETALRRAELLINNNPPTVSGKKTWFLSLRTSPSRPLNLTHEYVLAFHEAQDYQADFWSLKVGTPLDPSVSYGEMVEGGYKDQRVDEAMLGRGEVIYIQGYKWASPIQTYFLAPFTPDTWHNFGLYLDYDDNKMQILYSTGLAELETTTALLANNLSGKAPTTLGETHIGIQKKPVGANLTNYLFEGEQEFGIDEGLVLGGVWQVDGHARECGML
ncbi:hypothetical protein BDV96DRAFT_598765 [Lophiotrema nucula]|uniref:Glycoside hydrolase 131 catalytic N-terminal domain-containing protein n=1 Tax=Lophiotrema nucula TaxID=690887 RepID=A0A6A5ZCL9_9PLEO|nr:hypothetical protein BDV96DRAFT_598765 [Lophiotrema nucula]